LFIGSKIISRPKEAAKKGWSQEIPICRATYGKTPKDARGYHAVNSSNGGDADYPIAIRLGVALGQNTEGL